MQRGFRLLIALCLLATAAAAAGPVKRKPAKRKARPAAHRVINGTPWRAPTYADSTLGDNVDGDDLAIRRAAVAALGRYNGSVVVVDPQTGRILTIVNQKLAFQSGFQPCSTIKLVTAFAALKEGLVERDTPLRLARRVRLNLVEALAHSNNPYFALLGRKLGFERVTEYARLFGLGERATAGLDHESPGTLPETPPQNGGVGMMTSFGEGISLTPLELAAMLSAIANGGTLYYLQYPRNAAEVEDFTPKVKRRLEIGEFIEDVKTGMRAAVDYGTARRANIDESEPIMGKTGTCTDYRAYVHLGWFGSFNDSAGHKLVAVVLLTGGKSVNGPVAAGVAGAFYRNLTDQNFFADAGPGPLFTSQACCSR